MVTSIMKKRTIRERKKNRRQTIAVWITTCIATALFAAVFSFASSCQAGLIEYAKDLSGDYDYVFYDVPREEADHIVNNRKVATAYQSVGLGYAKLSGSKNPDKPYVYLTAMDNRAMQKNALHLIKGRMPKNDHEILLSRHMMTNGGVEYRVGDTITLDISEREDKNGNVLTQSSGYRTGEKLKKKLTASFQVVGIVQRPNFGFEEWTAPGYSVITYLNPKGDNIPEKYMQRTDIYCKYTKAGLRDRAQTTADIVGVTLTPGVQKFPFIKDERITNRQINDLMERSLYRFYENWGLIRFERMDIGPRRIRHQRGRLQLAFPLETAARNSQKLLYRRPVGHGGADRRWQSGIQRCICRPVRRGTGGGERQNCRQHRCERADECRQGQRTRSGNRGRFSFAHPHGDVRLFLLRHPLFRRHTGVRADHVFC